MFKYYIKLPDTSKMAAFQQLLVLASLFVAAQAAGCYNYYYESYTYSCTYTNYSHYYSNPGSIIGSVVGSLIGVGVLIAIVVVCCCRRRRSMGQVLTNQPGVANVIVTNTQQTTGYPQTYPSVAQPGYPQQPYPQGQQPYPQEQQPFTAGGGQTYPMGTQGYPTPTAPSTYNPGNQQYDANKAPMADGAYSNAGFQAPPAYESLQNKY